MLNTRLKKQMADVKQRTFIIESVEATINGSDLELSNDVEDAIMDPDSVPEDVLSKIEKNIDDLIDGGEYDDDEDIDVVDDDAFEDDIFEGIEDDELTEEEEELIDGDDDDF